MEINDLRRGFQFVNRYRSQRRVEILIGVCGSDFARTLGVRREDERIGHKAVGIAEFDTPEPHGAMVGALAVRP
jgi:hypothetical protein